MTGSSPARLTVDDELNSVPAPSACASSPSARCSRRCRRADRTLDNSPTNRVEELAARPADRRHQRFYVDARKRPSLALILARGGLVLYPPPVPRPGVATRPNLGGQGRGSSGSSSRCSSVTVQCGRVRRDRASWRGGTPEANGHGDRDGCDRPQRRPGRRAGRGRAEELDLREANGDAYAEELIDRKATIEQDGQGRMSTLRASRWSMAR